MHRSPPTRAGLAVVGALVAAVAALALPAARGGAGAPRRDAVRPLPFCRTPGEAR